MQNPVKLANLLEDSEHSSTENDLGCNPEPRRVNSSVTLHCVRIAQPESPESDACSETKVAHTDDQVGTNFLLMEPESDHASDSTDTKCEK
jgi:hypothetical protein